MATLILYLAITCVGYFIGRAARKRGVSLAWTGTVQTIAIILLVFVMGSRIGSNEEVVSSLGTIGLMSLAITIVIDVCTIAAISVARRVLGFDRYGNRNKSVATFTDNHDNRINEDSSGVNKMTIYICVFVALGIFAGYKLLPQAFIDISAALLVVALSMLLLFVGIDIGTEGTLVENFKSAGWRVFVFPFVSIIGMIVGSIICALFMPISVKDALCVGSGLGWYSLGPAMLATYSLQVSAISFMHNVMRELLSILFIPLVARRVGYIECFSLPGSAAMDVCLPIVERATRGDVAVYSFITGAILSAAVPFLVSLFMNL